MKRTLKLFFVSLLLFFVDIFLSLRSFFAIRLRQAHKSFEVVHRGERSDRQKDIAILVVYAPKGLLPSTRRLIDAFNARDVGVVVVSNAAIAPQDMDYLKAATLVLICRNNIGQDFGAYQCGWRYVTAAGYKARKLFMVNDSLYYLSGIEDVIGRCQDETTPFVGLMENYQHHYHAQSFFLCFGEEVQRSRFFSEFWDSYVPYSTRVHAINKGEVRLSTVLIKRGGFVPYILFTTSKLYARMETGDSSNLWSDWNVLLPVYLEHYAEEIIEHKNRRISPQENDYLKKKIIRRWLSYAEQHNQSHALAFAFLKYLDAGILKRDLCRRGVYNIFTVLRFLSDFVDARELEMIEMDLRAKGLPVSWEGFQKFLYQTGRI